MSAGTLRVFVGIGVLLPGAAVFGEGLPGYEIVQITDDPNFDDLAAINNCGQIVYSTRLNQTTDSEEIFLYDNGKTVRLTDDDVRDAFPDINDDGGAWQQDPDDDENPQCCSTHEATSYPPGPGEK